ncbi:MAG: DUF1648 domain-containing protein [Raoultibacter sp.]|jgi:hypothetical protein
MKLPSPPLILFWLFAIAAPFAVTAIVLYQLPPEVTEIPMQIGFDGEINRTGPPGELWILAIILSLCNFMMALAYCANDFLYASGLVHGVSKNGALKVYVVVAMFLVAVHIGCTLSLISLI